jgi:hypothetical protein
MRKTLKECSPVILLNMYRYIRYKKYRKRLYAILPKQILIPKNLYSNQRCFIIGNGPSIAYMDLTKLQNEHTIIMNKGYLLCEQGSIGMPATFYGISDKHAYNEYGHEIPNNIAKYICVFGAVPWNSSLKNVNVMDMYSGNAKNKYMSSGFFQFDLEETLAHTYTVALQMLQVAVYAGYKNIYFIGIDNNFSGYNMHFYPDSEREKISMSNWKIDPCDDNEQAFAAAYKMLKRKGINLYNAGVGGHLKALPRVNYESLFNE